MDDKKVPTVQAFPDVVGTKPLTLADQIMGKKFALEQAITRLLQEFQAGSGFLVTHVHVVHMANEGKNEENPDGVYVKAASVTMMPAVGASIEDLKIIEDK